MMVSFLPLIVCGMWMGNFYTNITVKSTDSKAVAQTLLELNRFAVITPERDGFVVVYDRGSEMQDQSCAVLAQQLSQSLKTVTLAVINHDDSVLVYWLYENGKLMDRFNSEPSYFDASDEPQGGDARVLSRVLGKPEKAEKIDKVLHFQVEGEMEDPYVWETNRHAELVELLGLPDWAVGFGYNYLAKGEAPKGFPHDKVFYTEPE